MNLSSSTLMAGYIPKTQMNNFVNRTPTPTKSYLMTGSDIINEPPNKSALHHTSSPQRYSPELESLRREISDQMRGLFYSLVGDVNSLKKDNSDHKFQIDELRRELDSANSKISQSKNWGASEYQKPKESLTSTKDSKTNEPLRNSWARNDGRLDDFTHDEHKLNEKISHLSHQVNMLVGDLEAIKKINFISKEQFDRSVGNIIDELEKKLHIINERVRERLEEMDINLVESFKEKDQDFSKMYYDIRNIQSSMIRVSDQVNTFIHSTEVSLEEQVRKIMNTYHADLRNLSTIASAAEQKLKMIRKDESVLINSSMMMNQYPAKEFDTKLKELDALYQAIVLLEKEMRSKVDLTDLNINSIKRNLELELSVQLKNMVFPIQKNVEQYLQNTEGRFNALEDAVLNQMKRDSYIMSAEKPSKFRSPQAMDFRGSHTMEDNIRFSNRHDFDNISNIEPQQESRQERKKKEENNQPKFINTSGQKEKEKSNKSSDFKIEEVDSVMSMNNILPNSTKADRRYSRSEDAGNRVDQRMLNDPSYHTESKVETLHDDEEDEIEEIHEEPPAENIAKLIAPDKDKSKKQNGTGSIFRNLEPNFQPDIIFRDFPSTSAMKGNLELENPNNKADRPSSKKKKPEIDVGEASKGNSKESAKKSSPKTSPLNLDSRLEILGNEDDHSPVSRKEPNTRDKKSVDKKKEPEIIDDEPVEEFQGNIKGLLRKSRNSKRESQTNLDEDDYVSNKGRTPSQKGRLEEERAMYGREQPENRLNRNLPLPNKSFDKGNNLGRNLDAGNKGQKQAMLPPVDTKSIKNFNKSAPAKPQLGQGKNPLFNNQRQNMGNTWGMQQNRYDEEDGESVEELVYHVDEEGFLVDEQGNYLVDEQGNFLQLSPEQMREIEERDLIYEKEY